jgi:hypothetical protein
MFVKPNPNVTRKMKIQTSVPTPTRSPLKKMGNAIAKAAEGFAKSVARVVGGNTHGQRR